MANKSSKALAPPKRRTAAIAETMAAASGINQIGGNLQASYIKPRLRAIAQYTVGPDLLVLSFALLDRVVTP